MFSKLQHHMEEMLYDFPSLKIKVPERKEIFRNFNMKVKSFRTMLHFRLFLGIFLFQTLLLMGIGNKVEICNIYLNL